jgi:hypothetical protein
MRARLTRLFSSPTTASAVVPGYRSLATCRPRPAAARTIPDYRIPCELDAALADGSSRPASEAVSRGGHPHARGERAAA